MIKAKNSLGAIRVRLAGSDVTIEALDLAEDHTAYLEATKELAEMYLKSSYYPDSFAALLSWLKTDGWQILEVIPDPVGKADPLAVY